jgi:hypothetical protein
MPDEFPEMLALSPSIYIWYSVPVRCSDPTMLYQKTKTDGREGFNFCSSASDKSSTLMPMNGDHSTIYYHAITGSGSP